MMKNPKKYGILTAMPIGRWFAQGREQIAVRRTVMKWSTT